MERLICKACGTRSMVPMEVIVESDDDLQHILNSEQESEFYSCHVCGDNWLSVKETESGGGYRITFVHQMGMAPTLKRIAYLNPALNEHELQGEDWEYFLDDQQVEEMSWRSKLVNRRKILKSICSN